MTNADIENLVAYAAEVGRQISEFDARCVLLSKELLARDPNHAVALEVASDFGAYLKTGVVKESFAKFLLPIAETDEELAEAGGKHA